MHTGEIAKLQALQAGPLGQGAGVRARAVNPRTPLASQPLSLSLLCLSFCKALGHQQPLGEGPRCL